MGEERSGWGPVLTQRSEQGSWHQDVDICIFLILNELQLLTGSKLQAEKVPDSFSSLLTEVRMVKSMVFLVVMYGCESWTIKKAKLSIVYMYHSFLIHSSADGHIHNGVLFSH